MKTEQKEEDSGLMQSLSLHSIRGRDRESEREKTQELYSTKDLDSLLYTYVCSMNTFIQVLEGLTVLQCSLRAPTLTPKYIPHGISFLTASRFTHSAKPIGPNRSGPRLLQPIRPMLSLSLNNNHLVLHKIYLRCRMSQ